MKLRGTLDVSNAIVTGSIYVSGSGDVELTVVGQLVVSGAMTISGSSPIEVSVIGGTQLFGPLFISSSLGSKITGSLELTGSVTASFIPTVKTAIDKQTNIPTGGPTDINGLTFSLGPGVYQFDSWLIGSSSSAAGAQFTVNYTGTVSSILAVHSGQATATTLTATNLVSASNTLGVTTWTTAGIPLFYHMYGKITTTTAGDLRIRASKVTSGVVNIESASWMSVTKVG